MEKLTHGFGFRYFFLTHHKLSFYILYLSHVSKKKENAQNFSSPFPFISSPTKKNIHHHTTTTQTPLPPHNHITQTCKLHHIHLSPTSRLHQTLVNRTTHITTKTQHTHFRRKPLRHHAHLSLATTLLPPLLFSIWYTFL